MNLREQIFAAQDLPREAVKVPEWGCTVWVRTLSRTEADAFEQATIETRGKERRVNLDNISARLVALCSVDADGKRIFGDGDAVRLGEKSAPVLKRLMAIAQRLNGLTEDDVEELAKNSASAPAGASPSV